MLIKRQWNHLPVLLLLQFTATEQHKFGSICDRESVISAGLINKDMLWCKLFSPEKSIPS